MNVTLLLTKRNLQLALLAGLAACALSGCQHNIVRAAPPSVIPPPALPKPQPPPEIVVPATEARENPPLEILPEPPEIPEEPAPAPVRPRPAAPVEASRPKEPVQISPQLSAGQLADAQRKTTQDIGTAERNIQLVGGRELNASQKDLLEKVRGFLGQAHEAVRATDWVRAQSLAEKAQLLSAELIKSF